MFMCQSMTLRSETKLSAEIVMNDRPGHGLQELIRDLDKREHKTYLLRSPWVYPWGVVTFTSLSAGKTPPDNSLVETKTPWFERVWRGAKRYPLPLGATTLLMASLVLWLAGQAPLANWTLLAVVVLGGLPLLWETARQFLHKEFSVDIIALLAIVGSFLLGQYLAGALIVLMLSGGEALEAYARNRTEG